MLVGILVFVLGLVFGSFVTEFSYRFPRKIPFATGRSFCDECRVNLCWKDNIPLISYLLLRGRCRHCRKSISIRYPLIEIATGLGFLITYQVYTNCSENLLTLGYQVSDMCWWKSELGLVSLIFALFIYLTMVAISVIDLEKQIIPDELIFIPYSITILFLIFIHPDNFFFYLVSGFSASLFLYFLHIITRGRGMGLGDVKLAILGGTLLGFPLTVIWMILSFVIGAVTGLLLIVFGKASFGKSISFGPYMAISLILTFLYGPDILKLLGLL